MVDTFINIIATIILSHCKSHDGACRRVKGMMSTEEMEKVEKVYDFIVVGGGVAGVVVARRLQEMKNFKVLLLEAGPEQPETAFIPAFAFKTKNNDHYDWKYETVPQKNACRANGGVCLWPRGKMLCGTACISGYMYTRGHRNIYDRWSEENDGWSYDEVLQYFKKSETNIEPLEAIEPEYHGFDGPIHVGRCSHFPHMGQCILNATKELGFDIADVNGYNQTGFTVAPLMMKDGTFSSPRRQFLNPVLGQKNLKVIVDAHVVKVNFNRHHSRIRATGVKFLDKWNRSHTVQASKEVILSAGVVGSPQVLLLSGVGPKEDLRKRGIKVVRDLRVGHNLHYHVGFTFSVHLEKDATDEITEGCMHDYEYNRTGPLGSTGLTQITGFMSSRFAEEGVPDIQFYLDSDRDRLCRKDSRNELNFRPIYLLTKCRGTIKLKSRDPSDKPIIDPNYLCNEEEVEALIDAEHVIKKLVETDALKPMVKEYNCKGLEKCNLLKGLSKNERTYWRCVIREYTNGENHHAGTCKMGPAHDQGAVVDNKLRVHGIENLRVADASIMPTPINCNTIAPVIMIAEKTADMIKDRWMWVDYGNKQNSASGNDTRRPSRYF